MARRYQTIKTQKTPSGKVGYLPNVYPSVVSSNNDYYIIAREEDRMDLVAQDFFGDATLWWVIAMANDLPGDSMYPPLGFQLRIPGNLNEAISQFETVNANR
jgi:glycine/D-amino acid oxidase-like deaminating enzyme